MYMYMYVPPALHGVDCDSVWPVDHSLLHVHQDAVLAHDGGVDTLLCRHTLCHVQGHAEEDQRLHSKVRVECIKTIAI